jgi:hypothetical protein
MRSVVAPLVTAILIVLTCVGCNRGAKLDLQAVSGKVSLQSRPLVNGTIMFAPAANDGLAGGSAIADGKYSIPKQKGLPPGKYKVQISSADQRGVAPVAANHAPGNESPPLQELVPEKYNSKSELSVEVKSGGGNTFNFDLR